MKLEFLINADPDYIGTACVIIMKSSYIKTFEFYKPYVKNHISIGYWKEYSFTVCECEQ